MTIYRYCFLLITTSSYHLAVHSLSFSVFSPRVRFWHNFITSSICIGSHCSSSMFRNKNGQQQQPSSQKSLLTSFFHPTNKQNHQKNEKTSSNEIPHTKRRSYSPLIKATTTHVETGSHFDSCPLCNKQFPLYQLVVHASTCNGTSTNAILSQTADGDNGIVVKPIVPMKNHNDVEINDGILTTNDDQQISDHHQSITPPVLESSMTTVNDSGDDDNIQEILLRHNNHNRKRPYKCDTDYDVDISCDNVSTGLENHIPSATMPTITGKKCIIQEHQLDQQQKTTEQQQFLLHQQRGAIDKNAECMVTISNNDIPTTNHDCDKGTSTVMESSTITNNVLPLSDHHRTDDYPSIIKKHYYYTEPIPGLFVIEDFITKDEEEIIIAELDGTTSNDNKNNVLFLPWQHATFNGQHYGKRWGVHCNLRDRLVSSAENPLPTFMETIMIPKMTNLLKQINTENKSTNKNGESSSILQLRRQPPPPQPTHSTSESLSSPPLPTPKGTNRPFSQIKNLCTWIPNECNALDYYRDKKHYLKAHVDDRKLSKEIIANLSLAGDCYMTFTNVASHRNNCPSIPVKVFLKRRCIQFLTGKARYDYSHAIETNDLLSNRRISVTMRESPLTKTNLSTSTTTTMKVSTTAINPSVKHWLKHPGKQEKPLMTTPPTMGTNHNYDRHCMTPVLVESTNTTSQRDAKQEVNGENSKGGPIGKTISSVLPMCNDSSTVGSNVKSAGSSSRSSHSNSNNMFRFQQPLPGLYIVHDFLTEVEEQLIVNELESNSNSNNKVPDEQQQQRQQHWKKEYHTGQHREKRYGIDHDLWSPILRPPKYSMPSFVSDIIMSKLLSFVSLQSTVRPERQEENEQQCSMLPKSIVSLIQTFQPNEMNSIEYRRDEGHYLASHVDDRRKHTELIINVSFLGDCYMTFTKSNNNKKNTKTTKMKSKTITTTNVDKSNDDDCKQKEVNVVPKDNDDETATKVLLKQRTLMIMTGPVRYNYAHGIFNHDLQSDRRISITIRQNVATVATTAR